MPVTKTAKRALRGSKRKKAVNFTYLAKLEIAIRTAKKLRSVEKITAAISLADKASGKHIIHKNKAARIKSALSKLLLERNAKKEKPVGGLKRHTTSKK